jgi:hypothetical protein
MSCVNVFLQKPRYSFISSPIGSLKSPIKDRVCPGRPRLSTAVLRLPPLSASADSAAVLHRGGAPPPPPPPSFVRAGAPLVGRRGTAPRRFLRPPPLEKELYLAGLPITSRPAGPQELFLTSASSHSFPSRARRRRLSGDRKPAAPPPKCR